MDAPILESSCSATIFKLREGERVEITQTTSTNQDDLHQFRFVESKLKLNNGFSSFSVAGLPGGNAAQDMSYYLQARAALSGGQCYRNIEDSCADQPSNVDQPGYANCVSLEHPQSSLSEAGKVESLFCLSQPDDLLGDTGCLRRSRCEAFESLKCVDNDELCSAGTKSKDGAQAAQASIATQQCIKEFFEAEAKVGFESVGLASSDQFRDQACISQEHLESNLSDIDRVDTFNCISQPDGFLGETSCIHRNVDEGVGCLQCSNGNGELCSDSEVSKDSGEAVQEGNAMEQSSQIGSEGEAKLSQSSHLVNANNIHQEPLQSALVEDASCILLADNLVEHTGRMYRSACEGSESSNNIAKPSSDATDLKVGERTVKRSHALQQGAEIFSEESLQSVPYDVDRVDDTSCASLQSTLLDGTVDDTCRTFGPDSLVENIGCLRDNACKGPASLKCFDIDANQCSSDGKVFCESIAMQLCVEAVPKTVELKTVKRPVSPIGIDRPIGQEPYQSTCVEKSTMFTPTSNFLTDNLTMSRASPCRIESADYGCPQPTRRNNTHVEPSTNIAAHQGNEEAVHKTLASEQLLPKEENINASVFRLEYPVESSFGSSKVVDSAVNQRSGPQVGESLCVKGDSLALPSFSSSNSAQVEEGASLCVKQVCLPDALGNSHSLAEPKSSTIAPLLPFRHSSKKLTNNICKAEISKYSSTGGGFTVCKRGSDSQRSAEEANGKLGENDIKKSVFPAYLVTSSSQSQAESISEANQDESGQFDSGGSVSPANFMHSSTQSQQTTEDSDKLDFWEERSVNRLICDSSKRHGRTVDSVGSRDFPSCMTSGSHKETSVKTEETQATGFQMKRKGTDEPQERGIRSGPRDKHRSHVRLLEEKSGRRLDNETLMSFRNRLVLQKQADTAKRKALESRKVSDHGEKNGKKVAISGKQGEESGKKVTISSKGNVMELKPMSSLTTSMVKDKSLKLLTRDIAKEALLEAGFRIDLRPRKSRDYQDSVYVSPDGHAYWSVPKAWEALKKLQAEKSAHIDRQGSSEDVSLVAGCHEKAAMSSLSGEKSRQSLAKDDRSALTEVFSRFGDDERLQSALTKRGACSGTNLEMPQDVIRQAKMTNADLTDILLGDLGLLRRFTQTFSKKQRSEVNKSTDSLTPRLAAADILDEKRGIKRKQDGIAVSEISERKILDGRGSAKKSQDICVFRSREDKKQETKRSLKQTMSETKATVVKHKNKKGEKRKARSGLRLEVRQSSSSGSEESTCHSTRTVFAWMIDRGAVLEREKIFFVDKRNHQVVKEGVVTREGILCSCCKRVFTVHGFEAHAGSKFGDWHQALVFTSGKQLLDRQLKAWDAEIHLRKAHNYIGISEDDTNDDTCLLCGDGGDLICCDGCPSTFHASCLQMDNVPDGDWYCPKCCCGVCCCHRHSEEKEDLTVILCNQCEHRYHIACLHGRDSFVGKEVFCGSSCEQIFSCLRSLVGISQSLPGGFSWTLLRCTEEDDMRESTQSITQIDCHSKLAVALLVIKECFNPMVDPRTNVDMITHAMYNRWSDFDRLNYAGFYTAVLEKDGEIISVATIRIHGVRLAEMPLIGTREKYRRQGMCRLLVGIIENLMSSLKVASFILPAIPELFDTWTLAFGFKPLDSSLKFSLKDISMMVFPGTELLQKPLLPSPMEDSSLMQEACAES
ncbi:hypothetical protein GOP47_0012587 [Adiantum capillus-veneris]|uniref:PHD-type domain-containing protein n=1 Tax=Adiantum capillus-veneris TaxID=13818 RepID=A0A9D4URL4_ADICA|nr:hypothetical protein GOP47_0012587 [Adiantum capillus-veneris]